MDTDMTVYGPQTEEVSALITRLGALTGEDARACHDRWAETISDIVGHALECEDMMRGRTRMYLALRRAAEDAVAAVCAAQEVAGERDARVGKWETMTSAAFAATTALVLRNVLTAGTYAELAAPLASVLGPLHPDDSEVTL